MRKVLIIAYYYPPSGGPGVQRVLKFTRYLPENGWQPLVLTVPEDADFPVLDPSLVAEIPPEAKVFRSGITEFYDLYRRIMRKPGQKSIDIQTVLREEPGWRDRLVRMIRGSVFIPDGRVGWLRPGVRLGERILAEERPDAILASGPPFTTHWIGKKLAKKSGLPLVLDFRDPWTRATFYPKRPGWAKRLDERLERSCLRAAAAVLVINRQIEEELLEMYPGLDPEKFHLVPNGFDEADFSGNPVKFERPTIAHTGSVFASRVPYAFLEEFGRWVDTPAVGRTWRLIFAGRLSPEMDLALEQHVPSECVERLGYVSHAESVEVLQRSHLLLLLTGEDAQSRGMLTGKIYEYLAARTPILALAPPGGEAAELLAETGAGWVVPPRDAAGVRHFLDSRMSEMPDSSNPSRGLERYSRRALTGRLAEVLTSARGSGS